MPSSKSGAHSPMIPTLRYRDAPAAIDWLCKALGFERHLVVTEESEGIAHAQLTLGNGMIMLGSARSDDYGSMIVQPEGGRVTQAAYIVVEDIEAHYARACAAGAEIVLELAEQSYGGQLYSCRDPEGHLWNFGSYDPWQTE